MVSSTHVDLNEATASSLKTEEKTFSLSEDMLSSTIVHFEFPPDRVQVGMAYKVNVYAIAECSNMTAESKELHEKVVVKNETELELYEDN